ncbi:hypothetical protein [Nitrosomonas ureae]|uniref:Uncharacterized protein n=1 Tax=Nitrosomonas ureae TaxID=44577 RepID=A0A286AL55_9PROT|nr:hypothetical protein [Nitrosomonas ureae]SOD22609.1 hypothetical protein SAMN06297164_3526 [Nitrosomonas ureae]
MSKPFLYIDHILSLDGLYFRIPRIVAYNRLEARPRTLDFTGSLRAEVRDPLWMLTRQWQFGEFQGEDAASPVTSRIAYQHQTIDQVTFRDKKGFAFDAIKMPLETRVERERIPLAVRETVGGEIYSDVIFAVQWGKKFLRMLKDASLESHHELYLKRFPIRVLPTDPPVGQTRAIQDAESEQIMTSVAGHLADGVAIWLSVEKDIHDPWLDTQPGGNKAALKSIVTRFAKYCSEKFKRLFTQPEDLTDSAWQKNHLEYKFSVGEASVPEEPQPVLFAEQYHQGHLDWYSFDAVTDRKLTRDSEAPPAVESEQVESFLPAPVRFKGQPQPRFWEMEETQTDFGKIETSTTGLLHLMLAEFGLIYSNDWFMLPHPMPINTVCEIRGILVDDTFGRHTFIRPAGRGPETLWQRWAMFHHTEKDSQWPSASRFYLVPAVGKVLESEPLERINFMRDEMANMVWGVESIVPSQMGKGISGYETARQNEKAAPLTATDENVKIRYVVGTTVPKNWIPFIPVHAEGSVSEIRLQRARMVGGESPRGWLLREPGSPYFVEEEEVPRTGIYVERSWQRTRWIGGKTFIWVGRRKTAGKGEGWSQLVFDQIIDLKQTKDQQ